jgi:DNA-binding Lrp family transcriptional regulator
MNKMNEKELLLISNLRVNSRESLTNLSKKVNMPISTIFDKLKCNNGFLIQKFTTLIDFSALGFNTRANLIIKLNKNDKDNFSNYIQKHNNVNSIYKINNGYDYMVELIFKNLKDIEEFMELIDEKFSIKTKQIFFIIEDVKRESFFSEPNIAKLIV